MSLSSLVEPLFPALMKYLLDDGFAKSQGSWDWLLYPLAIFAIFISRAVLGFVADYAMGWVAQNVITSLRLDMFERLLSLPARYISDNASGRLMSRVAYDVGNVAGAATGALTVLVRDSLSIVGLTLWLLYLNWKLTLITIVMVPFIALVVRAFSKRLRNVLRGIQDAQGAITSVLQEAIEGHKLVKIFGGQEYEYDRFAKVARAQKGLNMRNTVAAAAMGPIVQFFAAMSLAIIMGVALQQATNNQATVGGFVSFITAMLMILAPLKRLTDVNTQIQLGLAAAESAFVVIDEAPESDWGNQVLDGDISNIEFDNVSFSYDGDGSTVISDLSFSIKTGECVALVGPSGSGKSTIANLLPRFYNVDQGQIRINNDCINDIQLKSLRSAIALVSQDVLLFNDTIAANIAYGANRFASIDEIKKAADAAYATEFINQLPNGFETIVGERGVKLSGGQRQRLAIARALLKNAPILILDEATSALDAESEKQVQEALNQLMIGRTTLVIAHRLSTIEKADRIIVLSQGRKIEEGTHGDLIKKGGVYFRLVDLQSAVG